jgi:hypothetical protein
MKYLSTKQILIKTGITRSKLFRLRSEYLESLGLSNLSSSEEISAKTGLIAKTKKVGDFKDGAPTYYWGYAFPEFVSEVLKISLNENGEVERPKVFAGPQREVAREIDREEFPNNIETSFLKKRIEDLENNMKELSSQLNYVKEKEREATKERLEEKDRGQNVFENYLRQLNKNKELELSLSEAKNKILLLESHNLKNYEDAKYEKE